jgi:hypothetical protein
MKRNIREKTTYLRPTTEMVQVYSDIHFLAGSGGEGGVGAQTGSVSVGPIFGTPAKKFSSVWDSNLEENNHAWKD